MIIDVLQENLLQALNKTSRIVSIKPQLPILGNVLITAEAGQLSVTASNLEITTVVSVGAKVEKPGGICVPARLVTELVSTLSPETIHLNIKEGALNIIGAGAQAKIPGVAVNEFPPVITKSAKRSERFSKSVLLTSLNKVLFAAATDEGRPLLTGVKIVLQEDRLVLASTDGYRLAVTSLPSSIKQLEPLVVPSRALAEVFKVGAEAKETDEIEFSQAEDEQLVFTIDKTKIITRPISGEYPNYEKIIPKAFGTRALLDKAGFTRAVKSAAIFARDNANIVRLTIDKQRLTVSANTPQVGENRVELAAKVDGEGGEIAFNSRFLLEFLNNFSEEELLFEMTGSLNPGVFRPVKDENCLYVVMPVRVQG